MHRSIDCSTWDDPWFAELSPDAKLLFLYLITNRRVSQCGAMEITVRQIAFETGMNVAVIPGVIESMGDRVQWWPGSNLLIVRNFYRHQRANTGDKFDVAARKSAESLPDFARAWLYRVYPHLAPVGDTHPIPTPVPPHTHAISEAEAEAEAGIEVPSNDGASGVAIEPDHPPKPYDLLDALCDCIGTDPSVLSKGDKSKQLAVAKRLIEGGMTVPELRVLVRWLQSQSWLTGGIDFLVVEKQVGKWRMNGRPSGPPGRPPLPIGWTQGRMDEYVRRRRERMSIPEDVIPIVDAYIAALEGRQAA